MSDSITLLIFPYIEEEFWRFLDQLILKNMFGIQGSGKMDNIWNCFKS